MKKLHLWVASWPVFNPAPVSHPKSFGSLWNGNMTKEALNSFNSQSQAPLVKYKDFKAPLMSQRFLDNPRPVSIKCASGIKVYIFQNTLKKTLNIWCVLLVLLLIKHRVSADLQIIECGFFFINLSQSPCFGCVLHVCDRLMRQERGFGKSSYNKAALGMLMTAVGS